MINLGLILAHDIFNDHCIVLQVFLFRRFIADLAK